MLIGEKEFDPEYELTRIVRLDDQVEEVCSTYTNDITLVYIPTTHPYELFVVIRKEKLGTS